MILIKDMKMPKSCGDCDFVCETSCIFDHTPRNWDKLNLNWDKRPDTCPLHEITKEEYYKIRSE